MKMLPTTFRFAKMKSSTQNIFICKNEAKFRYKIQKSIIEFIMQISKKNIVFINKPRRARGPPERSERRDTCIYYFSLKRGMLDMG